MHIESPYHEGEVAVQELAGEQLGAERNGRAIGDSIMCGALKFIASQPMLVAGSVGHDGRVWASLLTGPPGFATAPDQQLVRIDLGDTVPDDTDPLWENFEHDPRIGMLFIEPLTRRRLRVNGRMGRTGPGQYEVQVVEAYPNCPKYIRPREVDGVLQDGGGDARSIRDWVESADTLFVASAHPSRGVDVSHRGGEPGFVQMLDDRTLRVPDYAGNSMFNTLGNLHLNPQAGLLFVDFEHGRTLQLTGRATIRFDLPERAWDFEIEATGPGRGRTS
jgi:predicted pyridoxine 5'-phosphate oxidase superfamily flavin-nucleotide-binding protein